MTQPHVKTRVGAPDGSKLNGECGCDRCGQKRRLQWVGKKHACCGGLFRALVQVVAKPGEIDGLAQFHDSSLAPTKWADGAAIGLKK